MFDTVRYLLGDIASVVARHRADGQDQLWQLLLTTTSGAIGTVSITVDVPGEPDEGVEVFGPAGTIKLDIPFRSTGGIHRAGLLRRRDDHAGAHRR